MAHKKQFYRSQILLQIEAFKQQQHMLLQRLVQQITMPALQRDIAAISLNLRIYEDLIFVLAKQGLTVPVSVHFVSLNAPQQFIASNGKSDQQILAPDEAYYLHAISEPEKLIFSPTYIKTEMPDYTMCNWSLGVVANTYLGHVDVKAAMSSMHNYLNANITNDELFGFNLSALDPVDLAITINKSVFSKTLLQYTILGILGSIAFYLVISYVLVLYTQKKQLTTECAALFSDNKDLINTVKIVKLAAEVQHKYGLLTSDEFQIIDIGALLADAIAVNAEIAKEREVTVQSHAFQQPVYVYGNKLRLMQIISSIAYEILIQLPAGSNLKIQIEMQDVTNGQQKFSFKFSDNGFYKQLQSQSTEKSTADVRIKGWENILALIAEDNGEFEHVHTVYNGNTICFSVTRKIYNNIVQLEKYLID